MRYIYMDNFRGFRDTILPLEQITFLVGENSTGKSSFLKLLYMLSQPKFWFSPEYTLQEESELGSFGDIVSAWSSDKSYFRAGVILTEKDKTDDSLSCQFAACTFEERDGTPYVSRYIQFRDGRLTKLVFQQKQTKYKATSVSAKFTDEQAITKFFRRVLTADKKDADGFRLFPRDMPANPPIPLALSFLSAMEKHEQSSYEFSMEIPFSMALTWIAPIRTKPQRFYDGMKKDFSPEGDHAPFVLSQALRMTSTSNQFAEKLQSFGKASGLFETIISHSFSQSAGAPFEILVKFTGAQLNINNVGYGVSQVLPLIVEFLSTDEDCLFSVQQPEVHLHPRAQAALGDLVAQLARDRGHRFILETHSDYLIDRCRLNMAQRNGHIGSQVIFFQRTSRGNRATVLAIDRKGQYPADQPQEFRKFFIKEEMRLLQV